MVRMSSRLGQNMTWVLCGCCHGVARIWSGWAPDVADVWPDDVSIWPGCGQCMFSGYGQGVAMIY